MPPLPRARAPTIASLAEAVNRTRWQARAWTAGLGVLSVLSLAPFFFWPILWVTLPGVLWLMTLAETTERPVSRIAPWQRWRCGRAAETGWWFGFGYHFAGLFWIGEAFLVEADVFGWLLPFAVTLLPAGLALFTAAAAGAAACVAPPGLARVVGLAVGFGITEYLRGHILTGFPWNILGYALTAPHGLMQSAAWFGVYGLTLLVVLIFAAPAALWHRGDRGFALTLPLVSLLGLFSLGWQSTLNGAVRDHPAGSAANLPRIRIVQPSVPQREKWRPENQRRILDAHLALSLTAPDGTIDDATGIALIVWPEAAMPFLPLQEPIALRDIGQMLPATATLATGALRADPPAATGDRRRVYNSLLVFGHGDSARVLATYDKTHLVPFGEYLPLQGLLEAVGLQQLSRMRGGFASGPEPRPLIEIPGLGRLAPLICYEAIFPGRVIQTLERPRALVNVTNDGWFGNTTGPRQHLHMARVRAVEEGVPIIRAANNGISAVIGPRGEIVGQPLALDVRGTIDASLPASLAPPLYARVGDTVYWLMTLGLTLGLLWNRYVQQS
jgi:apolipoprotein N-acyltransferase